MTDDIIEFGNRFTVMGGSAEVLLSNSVTIVRGDTASSEFIEKRNCMKLTIQEFKSNPSLMTNLTVLCKFQALLLALSYSTQGCGENEVGDSCFNGCEPTCSDPNVSCILRCGPGGCRCKEGYPRHKDGSCVPKDKC
ncbi:trypsin Inhibitor like cysteine rich domain protein [Ancylostoma duodenale]|uniref:Trypsin Inhibitor like cysteine rich domain protein n=1 Tax=Ancylostoma duodenale TaxID=51022 RepID=A0A0C2G2M7_9BILA|nr:trypsin Inhibitor like cysteine rich domain protein [Ancylostoma duodenale]